jgi:hypothetical protein
MDRPKKITFADMRAVGVPGLLVYRSDYRRSHSIAISGDYGRWRSYTFSCSEATSDWRPHCITFGNLPRGGLQPYPHSKWPALAIQPSYS